MAELKATQLGQTVDKLQETIKDQRDRIKTLDAENSFYHKLNYLLDTIRQINEMERGLLNKLVRTYKKGEPGKGREEKIEQCEAGI